LRRHLRRDALSKKTFEAATNANAHLIVQLKDNQSTLRQAAEAGCATATPLSCVRTVDAKKRNRHETRIVAVFNAQPVVQGTEWETHAAAIIQVERFVLACQPTTGLQKPSMEISFYLSSRDIDARRAADAIRSHWRIENKSHYTRDVTLREDASRIRKNPGVLARLRSFGYNILRKNQSGTIPQDRYAAALGGLISILEMKFC
jgi:predicted transposase YbfD/YdcC